MRDRHLEWFVAMAEQFDLEAQRRGLQAGVEQLEADLHNLRVARERSIEGGEGRANAGLRLMASLEWFWFLRNYLNEAYTWTERLLAKSSPRSDPPGQAVCARALSSLALFAFLLGDYARVSPCATESLALYRELGDRRGMGLALGALAANARIQGDPSQVVTLGQESLALFRETGESVFFAFVATMLASALIERGEYTQARACSQEALAVSRRDLEFKEGVAWVLDLARIQARLQGEYPRAAAAFQESLRVRIEMSYSQGIAESLAGLAGLAVAQGRLEPAVELFGAVAVILENGGLHLHPVDAEQYDRCLRQAREQLSEEAFARACAKGHAMTMEQAIAAAITEN